jgi:hypothetical protein
LPGAASTDSDESEDFTPGFHPGAMFRTTSLEDDGVDVIQATPEIKI